MVGRYGRLLYWQVSSSGTQTKPKNAKTQVQPHTSGYNIIQYLLNFGETSYSHRKMPKSNSWKQCLYKKLVRISLLKRFLLVSFGFRNSHLFDLAKFDTNFRTPNWTISKTMLVKQTFKQNKRLFSPLVRDKWQVTQSITRQPSIKLWNSITSSFSDGKALLCRQVRKKKKMGSWVHRRQKENSKDKPGSYCFLQVI